MTIPECYCEVYVITTLAPAPGADATICGICEDRRVENGRGALVCPHCDAPPD